jgi:hypothetical protein
MILQSFFHLAFQTFELGMHCFVFMQNMVLDSANYETLSSNIIEFKLNCFLSHSVKTLWLLFWTLRIMTNIHLDLMLLKFCLKQDVKFTTY